MEIRIETSFSAIDKAAWSRLTGAARDQAEGPTTPSFRMPYLSSLEESGSATAKTAGSASIFFCMAATASLPAR